MKASELRIGNWVSIDNKKAWSKLKDKPMLVTGIKKEDNDRHFPDSKHSINLEDEDRNTYGQFEEFIQPIPLTEEWLLKCGFVPLDDDGRWGSKEEELFEVQDMYLSENGYAHVWDTAFTDAPVKHVHQLQNLYFALTGKELTN
jgi:hypothetical protein